jgi:hypothetical protein
MESKFINLTLDNINGEHLCCAIADKKHQYGVNIKRTMAFRQDFRGHIFRKLNEKGKLFSNNELLAFVL